MVESWENQGDRPRLGCRQVSVSPQRFPSEKIVSGEEDFELRPLFTGQLFIVDEGLHRQDSGEVIDGRADMPAGRWPPAPITGKVAPIPVAFSFKIIRK